MEQQTPGATTPDRQYAGFGIRFLAYTVDALILLPVGFVISSMFGENPFQLFQAQTLTDIENLQGSSGSPTATIISFLVSISFFVIFWVNYEGATPGKKLLAIKIIRDNGDPVTYPVAFIRWIGYVVSGFTSIFFGLSYLWIIWDKKKQALHDKIAGTVVVKTGMQPKTGLAIVIAILFFLLVTSYVSALVIKGITLGMEEAKRQKAEKGSKQMTKEAAGLYDDQDRPLNISMTSMEAEKLAADVFTTLNEKRVEKSLPELNQNQKLCAYAQRRLDQLSALGKADDGRGFYEDVANPQISNAYFSELAEIGTVTYILYPQESTTVESIMTNWVDAQSKTTLAPKYNDGCVQANTEFVVLVAGERVN